MVRSGQIYQYDLPLRPPLSLINGSLMHRQGYIVVVTDEAGNKGIGEAAPLSGFSDESHQQALQDLNAMIVRWQKKLPIDYSAYCSSAAFAMSIAVDALAANSPFHVDRLCELTIDLMPSCVLISDGVTEIKARQAELSTHTKVKVKLGRSAIQNDVQAVSMMLQGYPHCRIALDANRKWSLAQANQFINGLRNAGLSQTQLARIDYIEEPCQAISDSYKWSTETGIALAIDESWRAANGAFPEQECVSTVILKPMMMGSIERVLTLIELAHERKLNVVISSSIESSVGLAILASLSQRFTPESIAGLDTHGHFERNLLIAWDPSLKVLPFASLTSINLDSQGH